MEKPLYQRIASTLGALKRCKASGNTEWSEKHANTLDDILRERMPSGSGFDGGTSLDVDASSDVRLVFCTAFHHLTEGVYDGWTKHTITVRPSLSFGFTLHVSGPNRNEIKDYIVDVFTEALTATK